MDSFPKKTDYYDTFGVGETEMNVSMESKIHEELKDDIFYKFIDETMRDTAYNRARMLYLYREEFKPSIENMKKKNEKLSGCDTGRPPSREQIEIMRAAGSPAAAARQLRVLCFINCEKMELMGYICQVKFRRLLQAEGMTDLNNEESQSLGPLYHKHYSKLEKGLRFALRGDKVKALKYKKQLNELLCELWEVLADRDKAGLPMGFRDNLELGTEDEPTVYSGGAAFEPILKELGNDQKEILKAIEKFC